MNVNFTKANGLVPVIIQDNLTNKVLMLGYMNQESYNKTVLEQKVTFFSRSKNRLWTKGETSGNFLWVKNIHLDCDYDTLLIMVDADGPTCHKGSISCFDVDNSKGFLYELENIINQRIDDNIENSYTNQLHKKGTNKVAQKVGEEAVELVIEAMGTNDSLFKNEAADLLYHFLILLKSKNIELEEIEKALKERLA